MKREIKFRKWSKNTQGKSRMKYVFDYDEMSKNPKYYDATYMQFTELLDKNGKEIYEGDIVKSGELRAKVEYDLERGRFVYCYFTNYFVKEGLTNNNIKVNKLEIVGNIYENPELLNP